MLHIAQITELKWGRKASERSTKIKVLIQEICGYWVRHHDAIVREQSGVCGEQHHKG